MSPPVLCRYTLDADDRIVDVGGAWDVFARENDGEGARAEVVRGRPVWDFVEGDPVRELYRLLFQRIRSSGGSASLAFRCDAPGERRAMRLEVSGAPDGVLELRTRLVERRARTPIPVLSAGASRDPHRTLLLCAWCRRAEDRGAWWTLDRLVERRPVMMEDPVPRISHGICPGCRWEMARALEAA